MRKTGYTIAVLLLTALVGCEKRLDAFLFNPDTSIEEYLLDDYAGEVDFTLPAEYNVPDSLIEVFTISNQTPNGSVPFYAIYIGDQSRIATDTVILYCHGNKDHMDFYWPRAELLANVGGKNRYGVLMIDYPGYGLSEGPASEAKLYESTDWAMGWLKDKGLSSQRLMIYGFSLGSAPATEHAANGGTFLTPSKLILENPFASDEVMVQDAAVIAMPGSFITSLEIDNAEEIKKVDQPFCWLHGVDDDFLSMETHGQLVYDNYQGTYSEAHKIAGAGHSTVPQTMGFSTYLSTLEAFITR